MSIRPEMERRQRIRSKRQRRKRRTKRREEGKERPHGGPSTGHLRGGGRHPTQRKMQTSQDSTQNVCTCCCRQSMETSRITTTGRTWMVEYQTTLYGRVPGAGLLPSQKAGMPRPLERWGAASWQSKLRNGRGFYHGVGTPIDSSSSPMSFLQRHRASAGPV